MAIATSKMISELRKKYGYIDRYSQDNILDNMQNPTDEIDVSTLRPSQKIDYYRALRGVKAERDKEYRQIRSEQQAEMERQSDLLTGKGEYIDPETGTKWRADFNRKEWVSDKGERLGFKQFSSNVDGKLLASQRSISNAISRYAKEYSDQIDLTEDIRRMLSEESPVNKQSWLDEARKDISNTVSRMFGLTKESFNRVDPYRAVYSFKSNDGTLHAEIIDVIGEGKDRSGDPVYYYKDARGQIWTGEKGKVKTNPTTQEIKAVQDRLIEDYIMSNVEGETLAAAYSGLFGKISKAIDLISSIGARAMTGASDSPVNRLAETRGLSSGNLLEDIFTVYAPSIVGTIGGYSGLARQAGTTFTNVRNQADIASRGIKNGILRTAARGALEDLPFAVGTSVGRGDSASELLGNITGEAAMGAIGELGIAGLGKVVDLAKKINFGKAKDIIEKMTENIKKSNKVAAEPLKSTPGNLQTFANEATENLSGVSKNFLEASLESPLEKVAGVADDISTSGSNVKARRFVENSALNSDLYPDDIKEALKNNMPVYTPISNKVTWENAVNKVDSNFDSALNEFKSQKVLSSADDTALGQALIARAIKDGNDQLAIDLTYDLAEKLTNAGQTVQAASIMKKMSPEGMVMFAQKTVAKQAEKLGSQAVKQADEIAEEAGKIIDDVNMKGAEQVAREIELPEEKLAKKISRHIEGAKPKKVNVEKDMVDTLYKVAQQDLDPVEIQKRSPTEVVREAVANREQYQTVWEKAQNLLKQKYAGDEEALDTLAQYFDDNAMPVFSQKQLDNVIKESMRQNNMTLSNIVKTYYQGGQKAQESLAEYIVNNLSITKDDAEYVAKYVKERLSELVTEEKKKLLGNLLETRKVANRKELLEKIIEADNLDGFRWPALRQAVSEKLGIPTLSADDVKFIRTNMQDMTKIVDDGKYFINADGQLINTNTNEIVSEGFLAKKGRRNIYLSSAQRARDLQYAKVLQRIADKQIAGNWDKFKGARRIAMLGNPKTMLRNIFGNVGFGILEEVKDIPGTTIDFIASKFTGKRTTSFKLLERLKAQVQGFKKGIKEMKEDIALGLDTSTSRSKFDLPQGRIFKTEALQKAHDMVTAGLQAGDRPFYEGALAERVAELKRIHKLTTLTPELELDAITYAMDRTFQNNSAIAKGLSQVRRAMGPLGDIIIPFAKTPGNIWDKMFDYSPGGFVKAMVQLGQSAKGEFNQKLFVDRLARAFTGTGLIGIGMLLNKNGMLTAKNKNYNSKIGTLERELGKQEYALKIGDKYISLSWANPAATPILIGAELYDSVKKEKDGVQSVINGFIAAGDSFVDLGFVQGLANLVSGNSLTESLLDAAINIPTQLMPSAGKQLAQAIDPYQRDTYSDNMIVKMLNNIVYRIPFARQLLPAKVNVFGEPLKSAEGKGISKVINVFFNPAITTEHKPDEVEKELIDLYERTGETDQLPKVLPRTLKFTVKGENKEYTLTNKEYQQLRAEIGKETKEKIRKLMGSEYNQLTDEGKIKRISNIISRVSNEKKDAFLRSKGLK